MKRPYPLINLYLLTALLAIGAGGCASDHHPKTKKISTLRLHLENTPTVEGHSMPVPIYRANPTYVNVVPQPFLSEIDVLRADVVENLGGFAIQIQFDDHGTYVLDQFSTAYKDLRVAIFSQCGDSRWLAAPRLTRRITDGLFVFTPDATREESTLIVDGLNKLNKDKQKEKKD